MLIKVPGTNTYVNTGQVISVDEVQITTSITNTIITLFNCVDVVTKAPIEEVVKALNVPHVPYFVVNNAEQLAPPFRPEPLNTSGDVTVEAQFAEFFANRTAPAQPSDPKQKKIVGRKKHRL